VEQTPSSKAEHRLDQYIRWTDETQSIVNVDIANGKIISEKDIVDNPYKVIPVV